MAFNIVPVELGHIVGVHRALGLVAKERRFLSLLEAPTLDNVRVFVLDNIKRGHPQFVAVSLADGVVGWCDVTPKSRSIYAHSGVLKMGLLPQHRGQGIATRLMRAALAASGKAGLRRIELTVRERHKIAIALCKKVGFVNEGLHRNAAYIDGAYENVVRMAILLPR